jgi:hypothetical protein
MAGESRCPLRLASGAGQRHGGRQAGSDFVRRKSARKAPRCEAPGAASAATSAINPPGPGLYPLGAEHQIARTIAAALRAPRREIAPGTTTSSTGSAASSAISLVARTDFG